MNSIPYIVSIFTEVALIICGALLLWKPYAALQRIVAHFPVGEEHRPRIIAAVMRRAYLSVALERIVGSGLVLGGMLGFVYKLPAPLIWSYSMGFIGVVVFFEAAASRVPSGPRAADLTARSPHDVIPWQIWGGPLLALAALFVISDYGQNEILRTALIAISAAALAMLGLLVLVTRRAYSVVDPAVDAYVDQSFRVIAAVFLLTTALCVPLWAYGTWPLDNARGWIGFVVEIGAIVWFLYWGTRLRCLAIPHELQRSDSDASSA